MAVTNVTGLTGLTTSMKTYYVDRFLSHFKEKLVLQNWGQEQPLPRAGGKTADWFRYHPLPLVTSAGTEGQVEGSLSYEKLQSMNITGTVVVWYNALQVSDLLKMQSRDRNLEGVTDLMATNAAESIERETLRILCERNIWPLPASAIASTGVQNSGSYQENIALDTATSTTTQLYSGITIRSTQSGSGDDDVLKGGWMCVSKGKAYGHCSRITASLSSTGSITLDQTLPEAGDASGDYQTFITVAAPFSGAYALSASHVMSSQILRKAEEVLFKNGTEAHSDGYYHAAISPEVYRQLLEDDEWNTAMSRNEGSQGLRDNSLGIWSRTKFFRMTIPARYGITSQTINSFSTTAGNMYITLISGKNSFGKLALSGHSTPELIMKNPGPNDTFNPLNLYSTVGWKIWWKTVPLNANYQVGVMSYV